MKLLFDLFTSFLKSALFTYGGGYAMIMMAEREVCDKRRWLTRSQFLENLSIAQSAPGPISINLSILIGYNVKGVIGAITAFCATALPSFVILIIFALFFRALGDDPNIDKIFKGLRPAVVALVVYPFLTFMTSLKTKEYPIVVLAALLVTAGIPAIILIIIGAIWGYCLVLAKRKKRIR